MTRSNNTLLGFQLKNDNKREAQGRKKQKKGNLISPFLLCNLPIISKVDYSLLVFYQCKLSMYQI